MEPLNPCRAILCNTSSLASEVHRRVLNVSLQCWADTPSIQVGNQASNCQLSPTYEGGGQSFSTIANTSFTILLSNLPRDFPTFTAGSKSSWTHQSTSSNTRTDHTHWANTIIDHDRGKSMEYCHLIQSSKLKDCWTKPLSNKFSCLVQGDGG